MKIYYTSGTAGDAYIILCKLYLQAISEQILCKHYTIHKKTHLIIKEIFSLMPNIFLEFLDNLPRQPRIRGAFFYDGYKNENPYNLKPVFYPDFNLPSLSHIKLPEKYIVIQPISGTRGNRKLDKKTIKKIIKESNFMPVFVGKNRYKLGLSKTLNIFNFSGQTTFKEDLSIIKGCQYFFGSQGVLSFFAISQKIMSTIYVSNDYERSALHARVEVIKEWAGYLNKINI